MDYIDELYAQSAELTKHAYNAVTNHMLKGPDVDHKENLDMFTMLSRVIEAQQTAVKELYTILVEAE